MTKPYPPTPPSTLTGRVDREGQDVLVQITMNPHAVLHQNNLTILAVQRDCDGLSTFPDQGDRPNACLKNHAKTDVARNSAFPLCTLTWVTWGTSGSSGR